MEKQRSTRVIAIAALLVGIVGLTIGFAAFTSTLTIKSSAEVNPVDDFHVFFSSSSSALETNTIAGVPSVTADGFTATNATIDNTTNPKAPVIQNLHATFTEPGQSVTYSFYAWNDNDYPAYLKALTMTSAATACEAKVAGDQASVTATCPYLTLSISVGSGANAITDATASQSAITGHSLASKTAEPIVVKISYAQDAPKASGDFDVTFADITLQYDSLD
ncbi:MAG: hypothetical protein IJ093_00330 [Bacilli bacterium]|nr:hypothetical protein [Bacilli bacterium]